MTKTVPEATLILKIRKAHTLLDIEQMLAEVSAADATSVDFWLARDLGPQFFKDARIVALLALAAHRGMRARIVDWMAAPDDRHLEQRFGRTPEGLASLRYTAEIVDAQKITIDHRIRHLVNLVIDKDGIRSPESTRGKSLTFCAYDPDEPIPIEFTGIKGKAGFVSRFVKYRQDCFERGIGEGFSDQIDPRIDDELGSFAYEIWQNTFQHGRLDENGEDISGMRYLRVQKHIDYSRRSFLDRAAGFPELQSYLTATIPKSGSFKFYEISIVDNGLGIAKRFLATRPEYKDLIEGRSVDLLINTIIDLALTSKQSQSGAGHGLQYALAAVDALKGFVSLRTGTSWLYYAHRGEHVRRRKQQLTPVTYNRSLASIGTQFNLIFPLNTPSK